MTKAAPRFGPELLAVIAALDDGGSAAEVCRRVGNAAERLGIPRPSYEQVRVRLRESRDVRQRVTGGQLLLDIWLRSRPATDVEPWYYGELPYRPNAHNEPRRRK